MSILIFANGDLDPGGWIQTYLKRATALIAADGGTRHVRDLGLWPDLVIGDLDSMVPELKAELLEAKVKVVTYPKMKDETDLQLALQYAAANYEGEIVVLGALGGRLDQLLANVFLLTSAFLRDRTVIIAEAHQKAWIIREGKDRIEGRIGDVVSLLPLDGDVFVRRTTGLVWPIRDEILAQGMSRGISNRMTAETASVEVQAGTLLCIHLAKEWNR